MMSNVPRGETAGAALVLDGGACADNGLPVSAAHARRLPSQLAFRPATATC